MGEQQVLSGTAVDTARGDSAARHGGSAAGKYLTFFLANEEYGIEILKVQEIIGMMDITSIPRSQPHLLGVINLRGKVIPVLDLRLRFDMPPAEHTAETCIVVVRSLGVRIGIVVDRVSDVMDIASEAVDEAPAFGSDVDTRYLLGIGKVGGRVQLLLEIDRIVEEQVSPEEREEALGAVAD